MRIALGVEYHGTHFNGWQSQPGLQTVQDELQQALAKVAAHPVNVVVAGRTDTGVHALGQVVHFDTVAQRSERAWILGTNSNLSQNISIHWAKLMPDDFHARFAATARRYRYVIYNHPQRPAIFKQTVTWHFQPLNELNMQAAANYLIGEHDFSAYRAIGCQAKSPIRTIHQFKIKRHGHLVVLDVVANAFLHHMVRNIAGVLIAIGNGQRPVEWAQEVLLGRDRTIGGITAPPYGLYLMAVDYPERFAVPQHNVGIPMFSDIF